MNRKQRTFVQGEILAFVEEITNTQERMANAIVKFSIFGTKGMDTQECNELIGALCDVGNRTGQLLDFVEKRFEKLLQKTIIEDLQEMGNEETVD